MGDSIGRRLERHQGALPTLVMLLGPYRLPQRVRISLYRGEPIARPVPDVYVDHDGTDITRMQADMVAGRMGWRLKIEQAGIWDA